ncbi:MAG: hypothetical protein LBK73_00180 [Treponema sp.]|nr:hypothetical protein [Treponema sp.]
MIKEDIIQRSPIKVFENFLHGGLKGGKIGVIAAPNEVGAYTGLSCAVCFASHCFYYFCTVMVTVREARAVRNQN